MDYESFAGALAALVAVVLVACVAMIAHDMGQRSVAASCRDYGAWQGGARAGRVRISCATEAPK
jgi:hypothetical protein